MPAYGVPCPARPARHPGSRHRPRTAPPRRMPPPRYGTSPPRSCITTAGSRPNGAPARAAAVLNAPQEASSASTISPRFGRSRSRPPGPSPSRRRRRPAAPRLDRRRDRARSAARATHPAPPARGCPRASAAATFPDPRPATASDAVPTRNASDLTARLKPPSDSSAARIPRDRHRQPVASAVRARLLEPFRAHDGLGQRHLPAAPASLTPHRQVLRQRASCCPPPAASHPHPGQQARHPAARGVGPVDGARVGAGRGCRRAPARTGGHGAR